MSPRFSIVIPTYKRAGLLRRAVESALDQEGYDDFEVVVVDDCSPDGTWDYLRGLAHPKLKVFRNDPRLGMGRNWNRAVGASSGEYVFILQDDDVALPHLLVRASELLAGREGAGLLCAATCLIGEAEGERRLLWRHDREELMDAPRALLYFTDFWPLSSTQVIFSRELFDRRGGFDLAPPIMSDAEAILRWMVYTKTLVVPETLALRRSWAGSVSAATTASAEMVSTMRFLAQSVAAHAEGSGLFDAAQIRQLRRQLARSFVETYERELAAARGRTLLGRTRGWLRARWREAAGG